MTDVLPWNLVLQLLATQHLGVLGTNRQGHAYASLVAFAAAPDARHLYFATTRATRKYHNLTEDHEVALLIDSRTNQAGDLHAAAAVTAYGRAEEVPAAAHAEALALYLARHPQLKTFVTAPSTALLRISVTSYDLVQRFQQVTEFRMDGCTP